MTGKGEHRSASRAQAIALALLAALLVAHALRLDLSPQDDAFISFRYAHNLLDGNGLVFNPGERVEGYTNFLWTLLMAPVLLTGADPAQGARALGLLCAGATLFLLWRASARNGMAGSGWTGLAAGTILLSSSSYVAEAVQGLETAFFALLVTAIVLRTEREEEEGGRGIVTGLLGGLAALTRPEGSLVAIGAAVHRVLPAPFGAPAGGAPPRTRFAAAARSVAICLAIAVPHRLIAWSWYGQPLPNTFYAKVGGTWDAVVRGAGYAQDFSLAWLPVLALALIGLAALPSSRRTLRGVFIAGYALYVIGVGGDYKWTFRFFVPVMPIVTLLAAGGAWWLASQLASPRARRALALSLVAFAAAGTYLLSSEAREFSRIRALKFETDRMAGRWLARNFSPGSVLATSNAGIIPYYSGLPTIDMLGLTDLHIAHVQMPGMGRGMAGHEKGDGDYVFARRPEIILFMRTRISDQGPVSLEEAGSQMNFMAEVQLWQNPDFLREYEWVSAPLSGYTLNYFRRRSSTSPAS